MRTVSRTVGALVAGVMVAGGAARADDLREVFGLPKQPPSQPQAQGCEDGLGFGCALATDALDDGTPYSLSTWLPASALLRLPVADAKHDAVAWYALGATRDEAGPVMGGASGLENRWTIDGAPADSLRTGGADTKVPLAFLEGILVRTGGFSARDRASTGGTIDARLRRGTPHHEVTTDVWSQLARAPSARPIAPGSFSVRRLELGGDAAVTASVVATGPLGRLWGGAAWYAAGVAPSVSTTGLSWRASRVLDDDSDGLPDGLPGDVATAAIETTSARTADVDVPLMARVGLDRGAHHLELSLVGSVGRETRFLANATLQAAGTDRLSTIGDAIATWRGSWPGTRARVQLAWHHSRRRESARDPAAASMPQLLSAYVPEALAEDRVLAAACSDTAISDPTPRVANCPVPFGFFASGGAGLLTNLTGDRPSVTADVAHRIGRHVVRAGATFEDSRLTTTSSFTGFDQPRSLFPGQITHRRFYAGTCVDQPDAPCDYASASQLTYRAIYAASYGEVTLGLAPGLAVDAGLRWELNWVGSRLHFSRELAPRIGVTWDALGDGRSRVWASYGKTFATLGPGLGPTVIQRDATVDDFELDLGRTRRHDAGAAYAIADGVEPIEQDEVTFGGQVALVGALRATLWGQGKFLRRGLETVNGALDNPGRTGGVKARRETELVAGALEMVQLDRIAIRAGVMWGRTVGTWTGPYDPRQGVNLLAGTSWDGDTTNLDGPLPTDAGTRAFFEAERRGHLAGVAVAAATRFTIGSGRPREVLADTGDDVIQLLPRGAAGRDPVTAQADVRLAARWRGITATLDVTNVFDRRDATTHDDVYTNDAVEPIPGGTVADLAALKTVTGRLAERRTAFQLPLAFQAPLSIALGVHATF